MKIETTTEFVRKILELSPEKLSFPAVQYLVSNPLRLSILLAWFFARTSSVRDQRSPAGKESVFSKMATDEQFKTLSAQVLTASDRWWNEAGLQRILVSKTLGSDLVRFINAAPELADYLSNLEFLKAKSMSSLPRQASKFEHTLFTLVQHLYTRVDLGHCSADDRLAKLCLQDSRTMGYNRACLEGIFERNISDREIGSQLLLACGKSVADQAQYIPSHFWYGRKLYFLGTVVLTSEGSMVLCMDNDDQKNKTPTPKWVLTSTRLSDDDGFLCWSEMPKIELLK
jgi:hypothetical protein